MTIFSLYISLFISFFKIGLFGFGGGYAMLPLIQFEVVEANDWMSVADFTDIVAVSQTTPGPIAFNSATYVGYTAVTNMGYSAWQGVLGSTICTIAVSLPSILIMTLLVLFFTKLNNNPWMQASLSVLKPAVIGLIASAALLLIDDYNFIDYKSWIIFTAIFIASLKKVDPILLIVISGVVGLILY